MAKSLRERFLDHMEKHPINPRDCRSVILEEVHSRLDESAKASLGKREYMWLEQLERMHARAV